MRTPFAFTSRAARRAPFSIVRPRYGEREKGALTTIVNEVRDDAVEFPPQPARARAAASTRRTQRTPGQSRDDPLESVASQVRRAHGIVGGHRVGWAVGDHASRVEDEDTVCNPTHDAEVVLDDEQRE